MRIYLVDAFTTERFAGNPAGVVLDADKLTRSEKQQIASEIHASETAFATQLGTHTFKVDFFTPTTEVDFCGHATVALFHTLASTGRIKLQEGRQERRIDLLEKTRAGNFPITVTEKQGQIYVTMTQSQAEFAPAVCTIEEIADALGISKSDLDLRYPIKLAKTGNWHLMVGVKSLEVLNGIEYDTVKLSQILSRAPIVTAHVFCDEEKDIFHARNFGPTFGIPEDPATGSAAGVFGAYLANEKLLDGDHAKFLVLQGESMGRTSHINIAVSSSNGQFDQVEITGTAVPSFKLVAQHAAIPALLASYLQYVPPRG